MKTPEELAEDYFCIIQLQPQQRKALPFWKDAFVAGYEMGQIHSSTQPKWVSVKERLPEHDQLVFYRLLVKTKNGQSYKLDYGEWDAERKVFYGEYFDYRDEGWDVTHWMPLPEAPKENE